MSHMQDINPIYHNSFGVAFQWKRNCIKDIKKIQLVFRNTGMLLSKEELMQFSRNIQHTREHSPLCQDCTQKESCRVLLLDSTAPQVSFAMNAKELDAIQDLVEGTLFQLDLDDYLKRVCKD